MKASFLWSNLWPSTFHCDINLHIFIKRFAVYLAILMNFYFFWKFFALADASLFCCRKKAFPFNLLVLKLTPARKKSTKKLSFLCFAYCLEYVYHDSIIITLTAIIYILVIVLIFTIFWNGSGFYFLIKIMMSIITSINKFIIVNLFWCS